MGKLVEAILAPREGHSCLYSYFPEIALDPTNWLSRGSGTGGAIPDVAKIANYENGGSNENGGARAAVVRSIARVNQPVATASLRRPDDFNQTATTGIF